MIFGKYFPFLPGITFLVGYIILPSVTDLKGGGVGRCNPEIKIKIFL